jgi:hypothetical protein
MELIPKTVVVTVPVNIPELRGRHATTAPYGVVTSFRAPNLTMEAVDRAISLIDPTMSRALFMRLVVNNVALAINAYYDELRQKAEKVTNGYGNNDGVASTDTAGIRR